MRSLVTQFSKFGVVGLVGLVVDLAVFNALIFTVLNSERTHEGPLIATVISTSIAIVCNWLGNRYWTFGATDRHWLREGVEFALVSLGGLAIAFTCVFVSHYVLGFDNEFADNVAKNVVGLALGTAFRFTLYRYWVFRGIGPDAAPLHHDESGADAAAAPSAPGAPAIPEVATTAPTDAVRGTP